jgi:hypothetical protein
MDDMRVWMRYRLSEHAAEVVRIQDGTPVSDNGEPTGDLAALAG